MAAVTHGSTRNLRHADLVSARDTYCVITLHALTEPTRGPIWRGQRCYSLASLMYWNVFRLKRRSALLVRP